MAADGPYKCVSCNGKEFKSREELEKHNEEQHSTSALWLPIGQKNLTITVHDEDDKDKESKKGELKTLRILVVEENVEISFHPTNYVTQLNNDP